MDFYGMTGGRTIPKWLPQNPGQTDITKTKYLNTKNVAISSK